MTGLLLVQLHPTKMQTYFIKPVLSLQKYQPWLYFAQTIIIAITLTLMAYAVFFLTCILITNLDNVVLEQVFLLELAKSTFLHHFCQGSQNFFLSVVTRASTGLFISGEKNLGNCILLWQYCLKNVPFFRKHDKMHSCIFVLPSYISYVEFVLLYNSYWVLY